MTDFYYQLYSSRNYGLEETLSLLSSLGYKGVEATDYIVPTHKDAMKFKTMLEANQLQIKTCHFGIQMLQDDVASVIKIAQELGVEHVYAPYLPEEERPEHTQGWQDLANLLAELGKPVKDAGLGFGWHNHDFEFVPLANGDVPMDILLHQAEELDVEFDVAWAVRANYEPSNFIKTYGDRITSAHVKDIAPEGECLDEDGWADVGYGIVDWPTHFAELKALNVQNFIMEHDNPNDHARFAQRSIETMHAL